MNDTKVRKKDLNETDENKNANKNSNVSLIISKITKKSEKDIVIQSPAGKIVNEIMNKAVELHASDVHIEPDENCTDVRMRVDGMLRKVSTISKEISPNVISKIKVMGRMDIASRMLPQDGSADFISDNGEIFDIRIATIPVIFGEKVVIRLLRRNTPLLSPTQLGISGKALEYYTKLCRESSGAVIITGPAGVGKTTTMYTMISELNSEKSNITTLEDPIEYRIKGINQTQINPKAGLTFGHGLRALLRQDPDVIAIGEIRDSETAEIAMRAAITGHKVISTVHTGNAFSAIDRLLDLGVKPYMITDGIKGVISQRLVRKLCPHCSEEYYADSSEIKEFCIENNKKTIKLKRSIGCEFCGNTGYLGRTGVFSIFMMNSYAKQLISDGGRSTDLENEEFKYEYISMTNSLKNLVIDNTTSYEEAVRVKNGIIL